MKFTFLGNQITVSYLYISIAGIHSVDDVQYHLCHQINTMNLFNKLSSQMRCGHCLKGDLIPPSRFHWLINVRNHPANKSLESLNAINLLDLC